MTEAEWLACAEPERMLRYLIGTNAGRAQGLDAFPDCRTSDRKLRLFACACYHRIGHLLPDPVARAAVGIAERFTDGAADRGELRLAEAGIRAFSAALEEHWRAARGAARLALPPEHAVLALAGAVVWRDAPKAAYYASSNAPRDFAAIMNPGAGVSDPGLGRSRTAEERAQCELIRCIFRQFRPVPADPRWQTSTVLALAHGIYTERAFDRLPILADALEDAGCDHPDVLAHCRGPGPHVRGCWAVDLVLGKS